MTEPGFKRLWCAPKRCDKADSYIEWKYYVDSSWARFEKRDDAYTNLRALLTGALGSVETFRFYE